MDLYMSNTKETAVNNNRLYASHVGRREMKWKLMIHDLDLIDVKELEIRLVNIGSNHEMICPVYIIGKEGGKTLIEADISPIRDTVENCRAERWKVYLKAGDITYTLEDPDYERTISGTAEKKKKDKFKRRFELVKDPIASFSFEKSTVEVVPDCVSGGEWILCVGDRCLRYMYALRCIGVDYRVAKHKLTFKVLCPNIEGIKWKGIVLTYRYRLEEDRSDYFFPISSSTSDDGSITATTVADLEGLDFRPINWDVRMVFEKDGDQFWCHMMSPEADDAVKKNADQSIMKGLFTAQRELLPDGWQLSLACTDKGNTTIIVQQDTPYAGFRFRLKERLALLFYRFMRKNLKKKKIVLVYEKYCSMAQDNGFYFFKYCMDNDMEKKMDRHIYYVIDKNQPDYDRLKPYETHVLQYMSFKHMLYLLAARLLISSDSKKHAYAWRSTESIIRKKILKEKKSVFLQHGVFGLKRSAEFKRGTSGGTNLFIASNELEKGFIVDNMGYKPDQVAITGLARWDVLEDKSVDTDQKRVLVMPTWRKWLEDTTDKIFLESEYFLTYMELINSDKLADYLRRHDLRMDFYVHPKISEKIEEFSTTSDRIRLIPFGSEPLNDLLMECSLLITDYSSVCWDVYYQGKPVIFYQFDLAKYNEAQGAYMDLEKDLFGDRAETQDALFVLLKESAENDFDLKPRYAEMREGLFSYIDHENSKRTCEEIMRRGW